LQLISLERLIAYGGNSATHPACPIELSCANVIPSTLRLSLPLVTTQIDALVASLLLLKCHLVIRVLQSGGLQVPGNARVAINRRLHFACSERGFPPRPSTYAWGLCVEPPHQLPPLLAARASMEVPCIWQGCMAAILAESHNSHCLLWDWLQVTVVAAAH
jgi:hypothetical protein